MSQQEFFENAAAPKRVEVFPAFLSETEEAELIKHFESLEWQQIKMHGVTAKRKVAHFGVDYAYTKRAVREGPPAPAWLDSVTARAAALINEPPAALEEILITYYPAGAGIGWHKDAEPFGDAIVGVSLASGCTMKFRRPETTPVFKFELPRRSAYVFAGDARWNWHHSISDHKSDRYSITFRTLRVSK